MHVSLVKVRGEVRRLVVVVMDSDACSSDCKGCCLDSADELVKVGWADWVEPEYVGVVLDELNGLDGIGEREVSSGRGSGASVAVVVVVVSH